MKLLRETAAKAAILFGVMTVLCGLLYTLAMTGIGQIFFQNQANGSIIEADGVIYGSRLLGQQFTEEEHLWGRIMLPDVTSYTSEEGEILLYGGASNKSPAGEAFEAAVLERVERIRKANPDAAEESIPVELVTCSGSGLDPEISPAAAEFQVPRIAKAKGISEGEVEEIIKTYTTGKLFGILGEERVNVLEVNLALDGIITEAS